MADYSELAAEHAAAMRHTRTPRTSTIVRLTKATSTMTDCQHENLACIACDEQIDSPNAPTLSAADIRILLAVHRMASNSTNESVSRADLQRATTIIEDLAAKSGIKA